MKKFILTFLLATSLEAANWKKLWKISAGALITVNALDVASSIGKQEANPLLQNANGKFSPLKGIALKSAVVGTGLLLQHKYGDKKLSTVSTLVITGGYSAVVIKNFK